MQCAGLRDRNGKNIYEGDIFKVADKKNIFEVRFGAGCFLAYENNKQFGIVAEIMPIFLEVIGNIYENPELLEEP